MIASGVIGNFLENFDFMICAFLAPFIAITFLPSNTMANSILNTFSIFFIGYLSRPIGGLLIGLYADQLGRKTALIFSIVMVGVCTAIIGIIPSYQSIGIAATILFSFFRILQNICVGGEYISSIAYLIENADQKERGFFGSWISVGFNMGSLFASLSVFILIYFIESNILPTWSWRLIFIVAVFGTGIGFWIRRSLPESLEYIFENANGTVQKKSDILRLAIRLIKSYPLRCFAIVTIAWLGVAETAAIFVYSPIHMTTINHFSQHQAMGINTIALFFLIPLIPIFGYLSDYYSKIKLLIFSSLTFCLLALPYFIFLSSGSYTQILIFKLLFCIPSACYYSIAPVLITESFPTRLRCTSLALIYQITLSLAAGITPLVMLYLANNTGSMTHSPAYYLITSCILGLFGMRLLSSDKAAQDDTNQDFFVTKPL
ncbi:MFS transporter [Legionella septentrionalis]|uniref:MFS transporter n=1 Tax=Legionella septentrionalis TaxID=2498109 RepID=A0A433JIR8_9GAMM|nr:MFS transporter [Legionella septentrionalis]RUQ85152.1 MFS transporter [Legionella septentrionalis]